MRIGFWSLSKYEHDTFQWLGLFHLFPQRIDTLSRALCDKCGILSCEHEPYSQSMHRPPLKPRVIVHPGEAHDLAMSLARGADSLERRPECRTVKVCGYTECDGQVVGADQEDVDALDLGDGVGVRDGRSGLEHHEHRRPQRVALIDDFGLGGRLHGELRQLCRHRPMALWRVFAYRHGGFGLLWIRAPLSVRCSLLAE